MTLPDQEDEREPEEDDGLPVSPPPTRSVSGDYTPVPDQEPERL